MVLPIYTEPSGVLHQEAEQVTDITPDIQQLVADMRQTMSNALGLGLAAPQVGKLISLCIVELNDPEMDEQIPFQVFINPRITWKSEKQSFFNEACLSIPGVEGPVKRPDRVRVKAKNLKGQPIEVEAKGLFARVLQHEIDHLHGILFTEYVDKKKLIDRPLVEYPQIQA